MKTFLSIVFALWTISVVAAMGHEKENKTSTTILVVDADTREPIIGADVHIVGFASVFYTDPEGIIEVDYPEREALEFKVSYISYEDIHCSFSKASAQIVISLKGR